MFEKKWAKGNLTSGFSLLEAKIARMAHFFSVNDTILATFAASHFIVDS